MKKTALVIIFCSLTSIYAFSQSNQLLHSAKPNIVLFLVDDMGWQDCSVPFWNQVTPFNKIYHTPNMQRLADEGMKFTNAYATPVCTPTRTSFMSGMNVTHHGISSWTSPNKNNNTDELDDQMSPAEWNLNGLSPVPGIEKTMYATTFPSLLKKDGYFTIHVGKAHWASMGTPGTDPKNLGFIVNVAGHAGGHPQSYLGEDNYGNITGKTQPQAVPDLESYFGSATFLTEALTKEALNALETPIENKQPFFLSMAHYAIHVPIMADKRFVQKYYDAGMDSTEAKYAALIEGMDKSLGDLMDYLKQKKVDQNTIIIFMSDNGGLGLVPPRRGVAQTQNLPLKAGKGSVYEGGIREPMIVKWPGVVKPKSIANQYVIAEDFFPTILEMAKVKNYKTVQTIDGKSFMPSLKNEKYSDTTRELIWHMPNKWISKDGPGINYYSAIRKGQWKMIYSMRTGKKELYNLVEDIGEQQDISNAYPQKVKQLSNILSNQLRRWNTPMPYFRATNKKVPLPDELF